MFILPAIGGLYASLGAEMPPMARILIGIGNKLRSHGIYLLLVLLVIVVVVFLYIRTPGGR